MGQRAEGYCIHCGQEVAHNEDGELIAHRTLLATCGNFYDPNPQDHALPQLDDEEDD